MIPILYEASEVNFTSNGVCRLAEATECHVTEERNGEYEPTLTYPITDKYYDQIQEGMYIAATHDDKGDRQAFRIYRHSAPFNGLVQFFAHHISYMLNNIVLNPITATSAADAFDQMETDTVTTNPFTMWTDVTTAGDFDNETPASIRSALGGKRGSILDVYGGEYEWDMFTVKLHAHRGINSGVTVRYGKNLTDLDQVIDAGGIYNAIVPFWFGTVNDADVLVTLPEHYVAATGVTNPVMVVMDFSSDFQDQPTESQLRSAASSFLSSNQPWIPSENIKISFVQLWQTEEYKDVAVLQRLSLCDRVNVYYPAMGITAENVEIIKVVYNVLLDRYDSMELGDARSTFADTLINPIEDAIEAATQNLASKAYMQREIDHATELITGGLGGHIVFLYDANGKPTDMLVMDTDSVSTAQHVLRINVNGIGFSSTGVNGPYTSAWTLDGQFVADFITAGHLSANRIQGGTLSLGGIDNGSGVIHVYDANNPSNLIGKWDKDGVMMKVSNNTFTMGAKTFTRYDPDDGHSFTRQVIGLINEYSLSSTNFYSISGGASYLDGSINVYSGSELIEAVDHNNIYYERQTRGAKYTWHIKDTSSSAGNAVKLELVAKGGIGVQDTTYQGIQLYRNRTSSTYTRILGVFANGFSYTAGNNIVIEATETKFRIWGGYDRRLEAIEGGTNLYWNNKQIQVVSSSSKRYKHDIKALTDKALDPHKLYDLPVRQFVYNGYVPIQYEDMRDQTLPGFIAEEVAEIYPAAVIHNQDGDIDSWDERRIVPGMLALIQEQKKTIDDLQARLEKLENLVNTLM